MLGCPNTKPSFGPFVEVSYRDARHPGEPPVQSLIAVYAVLRRLSTHAWSSRRALGEPSECLPRHAWPSFRHAKANAFRQADEGVAVDARFVLEPVFGADLDLRSQPITTRVARTSSISLFRASADSLRSARSRASLAARARRARNSRAASSITRDRLRVRVVVLSIAYLLSPRRLSGVACSDSLRALLALLTCDTRCVIAKT